MENDFYSYLDSFNKITIIIHKDLCHKPKTFCLLRQTDAEKLEIELEEYLGDNKKYTCRIQKPVELNKDYYIYDEFHNRSLLFTGKIVRSALFDMTYRYEENDLGITYSKENTIFKIWTPVAKEIELELVSPQGKIEFYPLVYDKQGVWTLTVNGNLDYYSYRYNLRVNDKMETITDPYGISSKSNSQYNCIIDLDKIYPFVKDKPSFSGKPVDAIIYEASIRDFTICESSGAIYKGKYLGMAENHPTKLGLPTGLAYLDYLGITHLQLLPIFDFGGVNELNTKESYNWGYNPVQYNIPEGSYSLNPHDPYSRINELCTLIDSCHANNIRVIMDVVYNHVYDVKTFPFDKLVPGYFFRVNENDIMTEVSGCGNDLATERFMMRKFIIDSLCFWAKTYKISGFRFDLMGLLDVETINEAVKALKKIDPTIICYGEGWDMPNTLSTEQRPTMVNYKSIDNVGFFNDIYRNFIRGNQWDHTLGYASGGKTNINDLICLFTGSCIDNYLFDNPNRTINYVECHDNYTFYDFNRKLNCFVPEKYLTDFQALGLSLVILSQGVPFIHCGQEFMRSKRGVENSYNSSDEINKINWYERDEQIELVFLVRDLIKLRKSIKEFRLDTKKQIENKISFISPKGLFRIKGDIDEYLIYIKNDYELETHDISGYKIIFDGRLLVNIITNSLTLTKPGITVLRKEK